MSESVLAKSYTSLCSSLNINATRKRHIHRNVPLCLSFVRTEWDHLSDHTPFKYIGALISELEMKNIANPTGETTARHFTLPADSAILTAPQVGLFVSPPGCAPFWESPSALGSNRLQLNLKYKTKRWIFPLQRGGIDSQGSVWAKPS